MIEEPTDSHQSDFVIRRVLDAPLELVWKAWTEAERLAQWWGPKGCAIEVIKLEFRVGGIFHYSMTLPDGNVMWGKFVYHEIIAPQHLVYVNSFSDENGNTIHAPFSPIFPLEIRNVMTFSEQNDQTTLLLRGTPLNASDEERQFFQSMHGSMEQGFGATFDQLVAYLARA